MANGSDNVQLTVTQSAIDVIRANPGLTFSAADIRAINAGTLVLVPGSVVGPSGQTQFPSGCITSLRFESDKELTMVEIDGKPYTTATIANLNDFRETFKEAACCGHGVSFCLFTDQKRMSMLNVYPCKCTCDKRG